MMHDDGLVRAQPDGHSKSVRSFFEGGEIRSPQLAMAVQELRRLGFFVAAFYLGYIYAMSFTQQIAAPFWFPDAVLLCTLLLAPPRRWWIYLLASLLIRWWVGIPPNFPKWFLLTSGLNDVVKASFGALALRYFLRKPSRFDTVRDLLVFVFFAVMLLPMLSALGGALARQTIGFPFWPAWQQWFLGDALANLVLTPAILYWGIGGYEAVRSASWRRRMEGAVAGLGLIASGLLAFGSWPNAAHQLPARLYVPVPFLAWIAIRFGLRGASAALSLVAVLAIFEAAKGQGPFSSLNPALNVLSIQLFLLVAGIPTLLLAALSAERRRVARSLGEAGEALRESEARFRDVADTAPVILWMSGPDKGGIFYNKGWLEFTGRTMEQEFGTGWLEGVHPEDLSTVFGVCGGAFEKRDPFTVEFRLRRQDGEYRWLLDTGMPRFDADGLFLGYIGSCIDITERRQAELDHQLESTELARVGRVALMGELAASLAHEVNNPLGAMVTNASVGQRLIAQGKIETDEFRELLADIVADGHRAREVIEGIRNMVRRSDTSYVLIRPEELIQDLLRIVRADALARKVTLVTEIDGTVAPVAGHRVQLLQVLLTLTMNAFEALSVVRADLRRVVIGASRTDGTVCLRVVDSGPGFPSSIAEQLFEPFFSTKPEGTGMGLAIARSIVEAHGGTLTAENSGAGGARFLVCLPEATGNPPKTS